MKKESADIVVALGGGKPSGDDGEEKMPASKPGGDRSGLIDAMRAMKAALDADDFEAAADAFEAAKQEC